MELKRPSIDIITRWSSTYNMLDDLIKCQRFCDMFGEHNRRLNRTTQEWDDIEMILMALKPAYYASKLLQN